MRRGLPVLLFAVFPLLLGVGAYLLFRPGESDEDQIRAAIMQVADGVRRRNLGVAMEPVSRAYKDGDDLTYDAAKAYLFRQFQRGENMAVLVGPIDVALTEAGDEATATFEAAVAEGVDLETFDLSQLSGDALYFEVELQKEGEDWKVISHKRDRIR
jgi:hypothetical protein